MSDIVLNSQSVLLRYVCIRSVLTSDGDHPPSAGIMTNYVQTCLAIDYRSCEYDSIEYLVETLIST
jgi:hypothetical protein